MYCSNCGLYPNAKWRFVNAKQAGAKRVNKLSRIALFCITAPRDTNISCCALHLITASLQSHDSLFQSQVVGNRGKLKRRAKEKTEIAFLQPVRVRIFFCLPRFSSQHRPPSLSPCSEQISPFGSYTYLLCCVANGLLSSSNAAFRPPALPRPVNSLMPAVTECPLTSLSVSFVNGTKR